MNHLNLEVIRNAYENDKGKLNFGERLRFDQVEWLIAQAEKVERLESALDYVLTAKPEHYHDIKNMLEDFKTVIDLTLQGK